MSSRYSASDSSSEASSDSDAEKAPQLKNNVESSESENSESDSDSSDSDSESDEDVENKMTITPTSTPGEFIAQQLVRVEEEMKRMQEQLLQSTHGRNTEVATETGGALKRARSDSDSSSSSSSSSSSRSSSRSSSSDSSTDSSNSGIDSDSDDDAATATATTTTSTVPTSTDITTTAATAATAAATGPKKKDFWAPKHAVYIRGLPFTARLNEIQNMLADVPGGIKAIERVLSTPGGPWTGSVHVKFNQKDAVAVALNLNNQVWLGTGGDGKRFIQVEQLDQAKAKKNRENSKRAVSRANTLFVGGVPENANEAGVKNALDAMCGRNTVVSVRFAEDKNKDKDKDKDKDKEKNKGNEKGDNTAVAAKTMSAATALGHRGFCYVVFRDDKAKATALKLNLRIPTSSCLRYGATGYFSADPSTGTGTGTSATTTASSSLDTNIIEYLKIRTPSAPEKRQKRDIQKAEKRVKIEEAKARIQKKKANLPVGFKNSMKGEKGGKGKGKGKDRR